MEKVAISLRLPADLVGKLDSEATGKRRTRTLIVIEMLEGRYGHPNNGLTPTPAAKKRTKAKATK